MIPQPSALAAAPGLGLPPGSSAVLVALVTALALAVVGWQAARYRYQARIGLRNATRRKVRTALIVGGLMLATMFISTALTLDDTIARALKGVAVFSLGRVDEEVVGGAGPLGLYPQSLGATVQNALQGDTRVAGVAPGLALPNLLLVDDSTKQVRGDVLGVAIDPQSGGPLAHVTVASTGLPAAVDALADDQIYLNQAAASLLGARTGDAIFVYSSGWPNKRIEVTVLAVVTGGPLAGRPSALLPLAATQETLGAPGQINRVYIANTGDGLTGVGYSDAIASKVLNALHKRYRVSEVKRDGVSYALQAQEVFGRVLTLYTLFALAIGLLLIFLIFSLLAAERRSELGIARAVGMQRSGIVWMLMFEGAAYDLVAVGPGLVAGLGLGIGIIYAVGPTVTQLGLPLQVVVDPQSVVIGLCLGILFTLVTIGLAVGAVTRITVAAALRNLPEPMPPVPPLWLTVKQAVRSTRPSSTLRSAVLGWGIVLWGVTRRGIVPGAVGLILLRGPNLERSPLLRSLGVTSVLCGVVLVARTLVVAAGVPLLRSWGGAEADRAIIRLNRRADRMAALLFGLALALYWSLPFNALQTFGVERAGGGVEIFFGAGVMMILGAILALASNLDVALKPLQWLARRFGRARRVTYLALIYPAQQRLRTGLSLAMFSLVCFTMAVMACVAASASARYADLGALSGGYDIVGQPLFANVGGTDKALSLIAHGAPAARRDIIAAGIETPVPLILIQPSAKEARWGVYPAAALGGSFLDGRGFQLVARSPIYRSDAEVWQALRDEPGAVVIDTGALDAADLAAIGAASPGPVGIQQFVAPPIASGLLGFSALEALSGRTAALAAEDRIPPEVRAVLNDQRLLRNYSLQLHGVAQGGGTIADTVVWAADPRGGAPVSLRVIGVVANTTAQNYGILGSSETMAPLEQEQAPFAGEYYFFKLREGADQAEDSREISAALLDYGVETTVIREALLDVNSPAVFASRVLIGLVGFTLLIGMAALAVTGTRAVAERRQQIGMLRALGYRRRDVARLFAAEALLVGGLGAALGMGLGLVLCRNIFAVSFFERTGGDLELVVPWPALAAIYALAAGTALVAAILPAAQGGRVAPADALRYE